MDPLKLRGIKTVLIANRGEISVQCIRACRTAGVRSVSIYTKSDAGSLHATSGDISVLLDHDGSSGYFEMYGFPLSTYLRTLHRVFTLPLTSISLTILLEIT